MKMLTCTCGYTIRGKTVADVMKKGAAHGKKVHPSVKMTPAALKKLKAGIRDVKAR